MTKKITLKEYGDWLFKEEQSIIYEKHSLNEGIGDWIADFGQAAIAAIGAIPPLEATGISEIADATNAAIYLARGQYINALFSFISVAPMIGDAIGKSGMVIRYLNNLRRGGGRAAEFAGWILRNMPRIRPALQTLKTFVNSNKLKIKFVLGYAGRRFRELQNARSSSTAETLAEQSEISTEDEDELSNLPQPVRTILDFILRNSAFSQYFVRAEVVRRLQNAVDTIEELFSDLLNLVNDVEENSEDVEQVSSDSERSTLNENVITEARLKKLAGINA